MAVSKALLISGIFMPNEALAPALVLVLGLLSPAAGVISAARSQDPICWERATEKNRNIEMALVDRPKNQQHLEIHLKAALLLHDQNQDNVGVDPAQQ